MVQKREQKLLDYLYEVGQQVKDYMRANGYYDFRHNAVSIDVSTDPDDTRYDKVTAWYFTANKGEKLRSVKKEFIFCDQEPVTKEVP